MGPLQVVPKTHTKELAFEVKNIGAGVNSRCTMDTPANAFAAKNGIVEFVGKRGDVFAFHGKTLHRSLLNETNKDRLIFEIVYNACDNQPQSNDLVDFAHDTSSESLLKK